jgi:hypothetical protein
MRSTIVSAVAALALAAAACSGQGTVDAGPVPGRATTTVTAAAPATTAPAPTGGSPDNTATASPGSTQVSVWLTRGELVEPVARSVPRVVRVGAEAVKALLAGPTPAETRDGFATAVPAGTRFVDLTISDGIAKVDLSRDFESGGGSLGLTLRLAQVACTVGQFPTVKGVRFALAGELVSVFTGNGIVLDKPVTCDSYRDVLGPAAFPGIWPFATRAELDAYAAGSDRTFRDPVATAREFAARYLGMADPVTFAFRPGGTPGSGGVPVGPRYSEGHTPLPDPRPTFTVDVRQMARQDASGPWTVTGAASPEIVATTPMAGARVTSPARVAGSAHAFEGNVAVQVREDGMTAGASLGKGAVTGGGDQLRPFSGQITFRAPSKPAGAVVFTELSAADGQGVLRATVVRIRF